MKKKKLIKQSDFSEMKSWVKAKPYKIGDVVKMANEAGCQVKVKLLPKTDFTPKTFLEKVTEITADRGTTYKGAGVEFDRLARFMSVILNTPVSAHQVGLCMAAMKITRQIDGYQEDSAIDLAGYAKCLDDNHKAQPTPWGQKMNGEIEVQP
jgi:hypothetical protein